MPRMPSEDLNKRAVEAARNGLNDELAGYMKQGASFTPQQYEEFKVTSIKPNPTGVVGSREVSGLIHQHEEFDRVAKLIVAATVESVCPNKSGYTLSNKAQNNLNDITNAVRTSLIKTYGLGGIADMWQDLGITKRDYVSRDDRSTTRQMKRLGEDIASNIEMKNARYQFLPWKTDKRSFELPDDKLDAITKIFSDQKEIQNHVTEDNLPKKPEKSPYASFNNFTVADAMRAQMAKAAKEQEKANLRELDKILEGTSTRATDGSSSTNEAASRNAESLLNIPEKVTEETLPHSRSNALRRNIPPKSGRELL